MDDTGKIVHSKKKTTQLLQILTHALKIKN